MTSRTYIDYLMDIQEAAALACEFVQGIDFDTFDNSLEKQFAVVRALEIVGEAAAHLPSTVRDLRSDVAWADIIGMRNVLVHRYFGVDTRVIWKTLHTDVPALRRIIAEMIHEVRSSDSEAEDTAQHE